MKDYYCEKHNGPRQSLSDSLLSLNNLPNTSVTTPSDKSSNESLNFKSRDSMEMIFPISSSHIGIKDNDTTSEVSKKDEKSLLSKSTNRSLNVKNGINNPKSVFRENSLIFGDMTLESLTDSQASSPHSLDSPVECVQLNIVNTNNNNEMKRSDSVTKHINGDNQNWISNSTDSGNIKDSSVEITKTNVNNNNIKNTLMNQNTAVSNENDKKEPEKMTNGEKEKLHLNNSNSSSGSNVSEKKFVSYYKHSDTKYVYKSN